ncbi:MAG: HD domain-containing protein, partial [Desulfobacterales bacterium]|nr:HD domain-containing protein [Desulfobacterales bacterium]
MMIRIDPKIFPKTPGAFLVGGSIRDMLCGRTPTDYDVAVLGDPLAFARLIGKRTNGHVIKIGKADQMIIRVVSDEAIVDIAQVKDASIENDLRARDFTINAMAFDLWSQQMVDPINGQRDLHRRTIRMVSDDIFDQDPVRLLRAYRIGAQFEFEIDATTIAAIEKNALLIRQSAGERVRDELFKMLQCGRSHSYLCQMAESDLLFALVPELADLKNCRQNRHHQFSAFDHTLRAFSHLEKMLAPMPKSAPAVGAHLARHIAKGQIPLVKFSMLLHDIGKSSTQTADREGRLHFYGHERRSAQMAESICQRLKCSKRSGDTIHFLVRHHTRPRHLYGALREQNASSGALTRFFMKCGAYLSELLVMAAADTLGKTLKPDRQSAAFITFLGQLLFDYENDFRPRSSEPRLMTGQDLIIDFGLKPSPLFSTILNRVEEERLSKPEMTREQAVALVKKLIKAAARG